MAIGSCKRVEPGQTQPVIRSVYADNSEGSGRERTQVSISSLVPGAPMILSAASMSVSGGVYKIRARRTLCKRTCRNPGHRGHCYESTLAP
jgi:hypothetical protein